MNLLRGGGRNKLQEIKDTSAKTNLESKALYESILYYLREFFTKNNNNLTYIILTNMRDFYIINAQEYLQFTKHKEVIKAFNNCENKKGNDTSTQKFYDEIKSILPKIKSNLKFTHFCLDETSLNDASALALIYQALSPAMLLKHKTHIDSNTLNQNFYNELLYILGLEEKTQNSKVLIEPSKVSNTLLDSLCSALNFQRDKDFETIFALLTTWNNRLLFLRLLESMLLGFKHITKPFLDLETLESFSSLNTLFFDVLAKAEESRDANLSIALKAIPYLNSSLFERSVLEKQGKEIKLLESKPLILYKDSILYKDKELFKLLNLKDKDSTLPLLEYLFAFLRAYDFTTTPKDIHNHTKINFDKLINAAVLGLVFEKLNGYKEGSFYTPSFITSYMCKQSLEKVVLQKFNSAKNWDCKDLDSLKTKLDKLTDSKEGYKEANKIFDSIHICDPAVGSGHFLVSALNELILLKFKLGILCDWNFNRIKDISLELQNDEFVIRDSHNALFAYTLPAHEDIESHKIQKALFHNKRTLIESCLFGVDINPNSCEITKLRLWIELLKYSYYKDIQNKYLETLPNIDINIKCGNSLISRFSLNDSLKTISNIKEQIEKYKKLVFDYKNADQAVLKVSKQDIESQIENIKATFILTLKDPKTKKELEKAIQSHIKQFNDYLLDDKSLLEGLNSLQFNIFGTPTLSEEEREEALQSYGKIQALRKKLDLVLSGAEYQNAFEWRFAFPEVLDESGDFLGFDLVIGNPPYIDYRSIDENTKISLRKNSFVYTNSKRGSIFVYFIEKAAKLIHKQGYCIFINPINYICQDSGAGIREFIDNNLCLISMIDVSSFKVFNSASTYTCINCFTHKNQELKEINFGRANCEEELNNIALEKFPQTKIENLSILLDSITTKIFKANYPQLSSFCDIFCALSIAGFRNDVKNKKTKDNVPFLESSDIQKYDYKQGKFLHNAVSYYSTEKIKIFEDSEIIFMARMTNFIRCCIAPKAYFGGKVNILHNFKLDRKFILGVLNSKLINYFYAKKYFASHMQGGAFGFDTLSVGSLPIPKITKYNKPLCDKIITLVEEILAIKNKDSNANISHLESQIDSLVYKLYNLTDEEIHIIES
ncbi:Eco57I restriction-modification methylase domain-containing protein [Helicobacter japonicus]|uniref:type IIG restriction enzyme/methyltransferase n=1 Tax=Helicobacter japonicus TaxID=425400 RepID=UPI0030B81B53